MASYEDLPKRKDGKVRVRATVQNAHHRAPTAVDPKTGRKKTVWRATFDTKAAARRWAEKIERKLDNGVDPDAEEVRPEAETLTLSAWRERWWPTYCRSTRKAPRGIEETDRRWRLHVEPRWGDTALGAFDRLEIQDWVDKEIPGSAGTVTLVYGDLRLMLTEAVDHRPPILEHTPCYKIRVPEVRRPRAIYTDAAGMAGVAGRCGPFADLAWCLWGTGFRWGELTGLRRDLVVSDAEREIDNGPCVDLEAGVLRVHPDLGSLVEAKGKLESGPPKTRSSARTIAVPRFVLDFVEARLGMSDSPFVFLTPRGGLLRRSHFIRYTWRPACDGREARERRGGHRARDAWAPLVPGMTVHGTRHSHKAVLEAAGIPDSAIEERLGHGRKGISGVYSHVLPEVDVRIVKTLQSRYEIATLV